MKWLLIFLVVVIVMAWKYARSLREEFFQD
jgi:hypothetical protein